jgi:hypothetical protein
MTTFPRRLNVSQLSGAAPAVFAQVSCLVIVIGIMPASLEGSELAEFPISVKEVVAKPRHNFVYLSADLSRPCQSIVTPQICICGLSPGRGLTLPLCGMVAGEAGLE